MRLVPVVAVRQNVYPVKGKGLAVHGGKTATALRIVPLPELVTIRLRARGTRATRAQSGPSFPLPGATASRPTAGRPTCGAASAPCALRSAWTG